MSLNNTPSSERIHIGLFGKTNSGKSSIINEITNQNLAIVSDIKGTTTDPVSKAMEILPLGPVVLTDTPGLDDKSTLGNARIEKTYQVLHKTDIALLVADVKKGLGSEELEIQKKLKERKIPCIIVMNKVDILPEKQLESLEKENTEENTIYVSAKNAYHIKELKEKIAHQLKDKEEKKLVSDLIQKGDTVVLVIPIDESAPKGRLILPQQQVIREILDAEGICVVSQAVNLQATLSNLKNRPKLVITDSQAFEEVSKMVPEEIALTSFSILFARYKGQLDVLLKDAQIIGTLQDGDTVLISEGCTHHRQCNDIGSVKIPRWLENYTKKKINFEYSSGMGFPEHLKKYKLIIHCGGCTLNEKEMKHRIKIAKEQGVPILNYGIFISYINGILERSTQVFQNK